ncbi:MAG: FKBP-type peptidyl-prolyl cis-trans isomerase [Gammaproteobacteria bacterium]
MRHSFILALTLAAGAALAQTTPDQPANQPTSQPVAQPAEQQSVPEAVAPVSVTGTAPAQMAPAEGQLQVKDIVIGKGEEAGVGSTVSVHYTGWLFKPLAVKQHGRVFDSSRERGEPIEFVLGAGRVIKGWDQGLQGMRVGGKRTLVIPAQLAYGARSVPGIPANSDLIFDVELVKVK